MRLRVLAAVATAVGIACTAPVSAAAQPGTVRPAALVTYTIELKTGGVTNAGTDGDVYLRVFGDLSDTNYMDLDNPGDDRERGDLDAYGPFYLTDLGTLSEVRVSFYPAGDSPDWYLDYVAIDPSNGEKVYFPCYCWFTGTENKHLFPA